MRKKVNDEDIIKQLKHMPYIDDKRDKNEWFYQVSNKVHTTNQSKKSKRWIPVMSLIAMLIIIIAVLPSLLKHNEFMFSSDQSNHKANYNYNEESAENSDFGRSREFNEADNNSEEQSPQIAANHSESHIAYLLEEEMAIYVGLPDEQVQYLIPITLITNHLNDLSQYYNRIPEFINEDQWGVKPYLFEDALFELNTNQHEASMQIPPDFTTIEGSALLYMFEKTLMTMFLPYDIDYVSFKSENERGIDLGAFGVIDELSLVNNQKASYKVYQLSEDRPAFLIPIPHQEKIDLKTAFAEMKKSEDEFHVFLTIPEHVFYSLKENGHELIVHFNDNVLLEDTQEYVTMIDAMLMTAKEFGFASVQFENAMLDNLGAYDLSKPVLVPDVINPIYIHE